MSRSNSLTYVVVPMESLTDYMLSVVPETRESARVTVDGPPRVTLKFDPTLVIGDAFTGMDQYSHEDWLEVLRSDPDWGDVTDDAP